MCVYTKSRSSLCCESLYVLMCRSSTVFCLPCFPGRLFFFSRVARQKQNKKQVRCVGLTDQDCDRFSKYACPNCTKKGKKSTVSKKKKKPPAAAAAAAAAMPALPSLSSPAAAGGGDGASSSSAAALQMPRTPGAAGGVGVGGDGARYAGIGGPPDAAPGSELGGPGERPSMPPVPLAGEGDEEGGIERLLLHYVEWK